MRTSSFSRNHPPATTRGWVAANRAANALPLISDGAGNEVHNASEISVLGGTVSEPEDGVAQISFGGQSVGSNSGPGSPAAVPVIMFNSSGSPLIPGDVVVTDPAVDSAVTTTSTPSNTRIAGIVQEPIGIAEYGPVLFAGSGGYTSVINTTGTINRGDYALTSATAKLAAATAARVAGSFAVYLTGTDLPDFASDSVTTEVSGPVTSMTIDMPENIPAGRVLFLALWLESGTSNVAIDGWTRRGAESGFYYFYKTSEGDDIAEATWTTASLAVATVLLLHPTVSLAQPIESHDYDATTAAAAVAGLDTDVAHYALAGVQAEATPGSGFVRLGGGSVGSGGGAELVQTYTGIGGSGSTTVQFASAVTPGNLIFVFAIRRNNDSAVPTQTGANAADWTTLATFPVYEGNKSYGVAFAKIAEDSEDGTSDGIVKSWSNTNQYIAEEWSGVVLPASDSDVDGSPTVVGNVTISKTVDIPANGVGIMVDYKRFFGGNTQNPAGDSIETVRDDDNDWPVLSVHELTAGTQTIQQVTTGGNHWHQAGAWAFGPGSGSVAGTLAGKYVAHDATATSPFTGAAAQNDAIFAVALQQDAKASALLYGPDLGGGSALAIGSNSTDVYPTSGLGGATTYSPSTHHHRGVRQISHASNTFVGDITLTASGTLGITMPTAGTINLSAGTGGGGGLTHSYIGYNTAGGSTETVTAFRWYLKQVTVASAGIITSVGAYMRNTADGATPAMAVGIWSDSGGSPVQVLCMGAQETINPDNIDDASAGQARWVHMPMGLYVPAGDYWLGVAFSANTGVLYYDTSGSDKYFTPGSLFHEDAGFRTLNTSSNRYSIRGSIIT